jgi:hypothetical protein
MSSAGGGSGSNRHSSPLLVIPPQCGPWSFSPKAAAAGPGMDNSLLSSPYPAASSVPATPATIAASSAHPLAVFAAGSEPGCSSDVAVLTTTLAAASGRGLKDLLPPQSALQILHPDVVSLLLLPRAPAALEGLCAHTCVCMRAALEGVCSYV